MCLASLACAGQDTSSAPATQATTQPARGKLEFRVAMVPPGSGKQTAMTQDELKTATAALEKGQVGRWWVGESAENEPKYIWLPERAAEDNDMYRVTGQYKGKTYVLLSNQPGRVMLSDGWSLTKTYVTEDMFGHPSVGFVFDKVGGKLFFELTKANIDNPLAIIVDGEVYSVPTIRASIADRGIITGKFTAQEAKQLAASLKVGMATSKPAGGPATQATH